MVKDWPQLRQETCLPAKRLGALCRLPHAGQFAEIGIVGILGVGFLNRSRRMAYQSQPIGRREYSRLVFSQLVHDRPVVNLRVRPPLPTSQVRGRLLRLVLSG